MRLSDWLDEKGWTDQQAADAFGVARETARLYRHNRRVPREAVMRRIAKATKGRVQGLDFMSVTFVRTPEGQLRPRKRKG